MSSGHLFLARANIKTLACHAWLVPGDERGPGEDWSDVLDGGPPASVEAEGRRVVRVRAAGGDERAAWLVHMSGESAGRGREIGWYLDGVRQFVERAVAEIPDARARWPHQVRSRARPLLALPLVGTGGGGARSRSGSLAKELVALLADLAASTGVDIALCLWTEASYAAAQDARKQLERSVGSARFWGALPDELVAHVRALAERGIVEAGRRLVLFLGAGVSQNAGLPSWRGLLEELARRALGPDATRVRTLDPLLAAEAIRVLAGWSDGRLKQEVAQILEENGVYPSLAHALLASLPVEESVTTNYDQLFDAALKVSDPGRRILPYESVDYRHRWLLKLHGSTFRPGDPVALQERDDFDDIVLTRKDYARYDLRWRALASIVETLLITRHMLFVGFSLDDPNFLRMVDTVRRAVEEGRGAREPLPGASIGTILSVSQQPLLQQLWEGEFDVVPMGADEAPIAEQARGLEIFLDRLGQACCTEPAYLLDPAYGGLLTESERRLRDRLEELAEVLGQDPALREAPAWRRVAELFEQLGRKL